MKNLDFVELKKRSQSIRATYHKLEKEYHQTEWTVEEDALAFLTDAGLVGRNVMSHQERWPKTNSQEELEHKLGECIWWLTILADRAGMDIEEATGKFLDKTEKLFSK
ncbi:MazG-like protein [Sinomicrobium pectinilyticum]|uniref:MazG-like protein n=1 Tax=Sinomicrobium pectinilyticum TaxID=1084421 RepID=A0A3N0EQV8_SINP1|nr:MazG-like protein [Sinomicrobium pectinilyticum]RNL90137.1 MazG-like protein [Sinomicrobium pectinilyticum]